MPKLKILFAGTPEFAASHLRALAQVDSLHIVAVYTQPDRRAGRGKKLQATPVKLAAEEFGFSVQQPLSLKEPSAQEQLKSYGADLMVVVAYGLLLPLPILTAPRLGCINVHASILPRWRGAAPIERCLEAGDTSTGITIMQMDVGLDTGAMLTKKEISINAEDSGDSLRERLLPIGIEALIETLAIFTAGNTPAAQKQDDALASYAKKLAKNEALIDWSQTAQTLDLKIRAFNSSNVTHTWLAKERLKIWACQTVSDVEQSTTINTPATIVSPGTIMQINKTGIMVACGQGYLRLTKLQLAGGKVLTVAQLLNSKAQLFAVGERFLLAES